MSFFLNFHTHLVPHLKVKSGCSDVVSLFNVVLGDHDDEHVLKSYFETEASDVKLVFSAGFHPWYLDPDGYTKSLQVLQTLLRNRQIKVIGECGLDKLKGPNLEVQTRVFQEQLGLAEKYNLPVLIHCVRAFAETIQICKPFLGKLPLIFHGFQKSPELAQQLFDLGFGFSFGPSLFKKNAERLLNWVVKSDVPILLETDDLDVPIEEIYNKMAYFKNLELDTLKDLIFANWKSLGIL